MTASSSRRGSEARAPLAALALLTRIPLKRAPAHEPADLAIAAPAFPLIGAGIGAAVGGTAAALNSTLTPLLAVAIALALGTVLTGALHIDGLADTADALGARTREHALAIMRDHTIGVYGAVALALDLLIKAAALTALLHRGEALPLMVVAGALSRSAAAALAASLPYARDGAGTGEVVTRGSLWRAAAGAVIAVAIAVAVAGEAGAIAAGCVAVLCAGLWVASRRSLGGVTGDTLGATVELCEIAALVAGVAAVGSG